MKKILSILIALMFVFSATAAWASTVPEIDNKDNCVVDMADVISQDTEDILSVMNKVLEEKTGASIVIATVDFTGSLSMEEYAYEAFNKWGIGDEDKDNGLLLVMSIGQEDYWAVQGKGLEKDLTSAEIDQMLYDYLESYFAKEDYDSGAKAFYLAAYDWFGDFYDVDLGTIEVEGNVSPDNAGVAGNEKGGNGLGKFIFWVVIIFIIAVLISASKDDGSKPKKVYKQRTHSRRGPHTTSYRRSTPPPPPSKGIFGRGRTSNASRTTNSSSRTSTTRSSSSTRSTTSKSSSTRTSSRISSGGKSGGFGGGSTRGGGSGRRK